MNRGAIISHLVSNCDLDDIAPVANNGRARNLAVHSESHLWGAIVVYRGISDGEVVLADVTGVGPRRIIVSADIEAITP